LKEWESLYGSVTAGLFRSIFQKRKTSKIVKSPLFSFRRGTPALVQALHKELEGAIRLEEEALSLHKNEKLMVRTARGDYAADLLVSALPPGVLGRLVHDLTPDAAVHLQAIPMTSLTVVHFGYRGSILPCRGFGYLVPTAEGEKVMGVVFDSEIFPEHNRGEQTRLTIMLQGSIEEAEACARDALKRHLGLSQPPDAVHIESQALPVMEVGHNEKISAIQNELHRLLPQLHLVGNYLGSPSVESCIERALKR
jgi:oxygen-dependent protoporphyrinogen oxidase